MKYGNRMLSRGLLAATRLLLVSIIFTTSAIADKKFLIVDDWSVDKFCTRPAPSCCIGTSCPSLSPTTCTSPAGNQLTALCSGTPATQFVWSAGAPCKIVGSFRDVGIQAQVGCTSNPNSSMSVAKIDSRCGNLIVQGNLISGESQTLSSGAVIWDYGTFPATIDSIEQNGLANSQIVSALGSEISIGNGPFTIPVCQKSNGSDAPTELDLKFFFADGSSYSLTKTQDARLQLTTACPSVDADLTLGCSSYNYIPINFPSQFHGKKLGAIKLGFKNARKLIIGKLGFACSVDAVDSNSMPFGERVYSCTHDIPACVVPTPRATPEPTRTPTPTTPPTVSCTDKNVTPLLLDLDGNAAKLRGAIAKNAKFAKSKGAISNATYKSLITQSDSLYHTIWETIWKIPAVIKFCTGGSKCQTVSYAPTISSYEKDFAALRDLVESLANRMAKDKNSDVKKRGKALSKTNTQAKTDSDAQVKNLPTESTVCQ